MLKILILTLFVPLVRAIHYSHTDDVLDMMLKEGYRGESHQVETQDGGWILKMHRIPPKYPKDVKPLPVFLMHGLFAASSDYLMTGRKIALGYLLADNNYDVWMGNSRGNRHATINYKTANYDKLWSFSFNEIGQYDLAAMIDYVLKYTGRQKLLYVGHSQGTTALLALLALRPEYNDKIAQAHLLAAVSFMKYLPHPIVRVIAKPLEEALTAAGKTILTLSHFLIIGNPLSKVLCNETLNYETTQLCKAVIFAIVGSNTYQEELDTRILPELVDHISWQISAQQLKHYAQSYFSGKFRQFDYGYRNLQVYNSTTPPSYDISKITAPMYIYRAPEDLLSSKRDTEHLVQKLPNVKHFYVVPNYNHIDFTYGRRSRKVLYYDILRFFEQANGGDGRNKFLSK